jgi:hypothetical protein
MIGPLITQTQIINSHQPILDYLDACVGANYNFDANISGYTTLLWVRSYTKENKYMCEEHMCEYGCYGNTPTCSIWECVTWTTWAEVCHSPKQSLPLPPPHRPIPGKPAILSISLSLTSQTPGGIGKKAT